MSFFSALPRQDNKFALYEQVMYCGSVCQIMNYEWSSVTDTWLYDLGAKVGNRRMRWHRFVAEWEIDSPETANVVHMRRP